MSKQVGAFCPKCKQFTIHKVYDFFGREWYECTKCYNARDAQHLVDPFSREEE